MGDRNSSVISPACANVTTFVINLLRYLLFNIFNAYTYARRHVKSRLRANACTRRRGRASRGSAPYASARPTSAKPVPVRAFSHHAPTNLTLLHTVKRSADTVFLCEFFRRSSTFHSLGRPHFLCLDSTSLRSLHSSVSICVYLRWGPTPPSTSNQPIRQTVLTYAIKEFAIYSPPPLVF